MEEEKQLTQINRYRIEGPTRSKCFNLFTFFLSNPNAFISLSIATSGILLYVFKESPLFYSLIMNILSKIDFAYSFFFIISVYYTYPIINKFCSKFLRNSIMCNTIMLFVFHSITTYFVGFYKLLTHSQIIISKNIALFSSKLKNLFSKTSMDLQNLLQEYVFDTQINPELVKDFIHDLRIAMDDTIADGTSFILYSFLFMSNMQNLEIATSFFHSIRTQISNAEDKYFIDNLEESYEDIKQNVQDITISKISEYKQSLLSTLYSYIGTDIIIKTPQEEEKQHDKMIEQIKKIKKNEKIFDREYSNLSEQILERSRIVKSRMLTVNTQEEKQIYIEQINALNKVIEKYIVFSAQLEESKNVKNSLVTFVGEMEKAANSFDMFNVNFYEFIGGIDNETGHIVNDTIIQFKQVLQNDPNFQQDTPITFGGKFVKWMDFSKTLSSIILQGDDPLQNLKVGGEVIIDEFLYKLKSSTFIKQTKFLKKFINDKRFENFITNLKFNYQMLLEEVSTTFSADRYLLLKDLEQTFEIKTGLMKKGEQLGKNIIGSTAGFIEGINNSTGLEIVNIKGYEKIAKEYTITLQNYQDKISQSLSQKTKEIAKNYAYESLSSCVENENCLTLVAQPVNRLDNPISVSIILPSISILFMFILIILGIFKKSVAKKQQYSFNDDEQILVFNRMKQIFY
jgi:hypothetical protein